MKIFRLCLLFAPVLLSACATQLPNAKLSKEYTNNTISPRLVNIVDEKDMNYLIPKPTTPALLAINPVAALAIAAVQTVEMQASKEKRDPKFSDIMKYIPEGYIRKHSNDKVLKIIQKADWIDVASEEDYQQKSDAMLMDLFSNKIEVNDGDETVLIVRNRIFFSTYFDALMNRVELDIYEVQDNRLKKKIYDLHTYDTYHVGGAQEKDVENYKLWLENDGEEIRRGIRETSDSVADSLERMLSNPYLTADTAGGTTSTVTNADPLSGGILN